MHSRLLLVSCLVALAACALPPESTPENECGEEQCVAIGESQQVFADFAVTPLDLLEDSRCLVDAQCVWAGRVRLRAQLDLGHESIEAQIDSSEPMRINGGFLSMNLVLPEPRRRETPPDKGEYRFNFTFAPDVMGQPPAS